MRLAVVVLAIAACGKSAAPDRKQQCKAAARDAIAALIKNASLHAADPKLLPDERASVEAQSKALEAIAPRFEAILANHCIDDKWPAAVIDCYRVAQSFDALRACRDQLPAEAQTKLQTDELDLVGGDRSAQPPEPPRAPD